MFSPKIISQKIFWKSISRKFLFLEKIKFILKILCLFILVIILAYPQENKDINTNWNIIFILDNSLSMLAEDWEVNKTISRIDKSKEIINEIVNNNPWLKYSLLLFSWDSYISIPSTKDLNSFKMILASTKVAQNEMKWNLFKSIKNNLELIINNQQFWKTIVILLSDWEFHQTPNTEWWYKINSIGIGQNIWAKIPLEKKKWWAILYKKYNWRLVKTNINEQYLKQISKNSKWKYYKSNEVSKLSAKLPSQSEQGKRELPFIQILVLIVFIILSIELLINHVSLKK